MDRSVRKRKRAENPAEDSRSSPTPGDMKDGEFEKERKEEKAVTSPTKNPSENTKYDKEIADLQRLANDVQEGSHAEVLKDLETHEKIKEKMLTAAQAWKELQTENVKALYQFELQAADHIYRATKDFLKTDMTNKALSRIEELQAQLQCPKVDTVIKNIQECSRKKDGEVDRSLEKQLKTMYNEIMRRRQEVLQPRLVKNVLNLDEVTKDLLEIHRSWVKATNSLEGIARQKIYISKSTLYVDKVQYVPGDEVLVSSKLSGEDFLGEITSIKDTELSLTLLDGSRSRVTLQYLQTGRCTISHYSDSTSSSDSE